MRVLGSRLPEVLWEEDGVRDAFHSGLRRAKVRGRLKALSDPDWGML